MRKKPLPYVKKSLRFDLWVADRIILNISCQPHHTLYQFPTVPNTKPVANRTIYNKIWSLYMIMMSESVIFFVYFHVEFFVEFTFRVNSYVFLLNEWIWNKRLLISRKMERSCHIICPRVKQEIKSLFSRTTRFTV